MIRRQRSNKEVNKIEIESLRKYHNFILQFNKKNKNNMLWCNVNDQMILQAGISGIRTFLIKINSLSS